VLEGGDQLEPACRLEGVNRAAQEFAPAALPRAGSVSRMSPREEMLWRAVGEIEIRFRGLIRHDHEVATAPKGVSKIGPKQTCIRLECVQPMPVFTRAVSSLAGNPCRARARGDIAGSDKDELLAQH